MQSKLNTQAFREAIDKSGLCVSGPLIADGKLRRFHVEGDKTGSKNGWYVLYDDGLRFGAFGCWKRGISETWVGKPDRELTQAQREHNRCCMIAAQKAREAEEQVRRKQAAEKAAVIWSASPPAPDAHPYLVRKGIRSHGARLYKGALVIPLRDHAGTLHSLQFIDDEGNKRFLSGGRKKGCFFLIASPLESICVCEGFATGASINESTSLPVAIAFDAGNLLPVAQTLRAKLPKVEITICADNDALTPGNPGLTKAREAALAVGARLAVPPVPGDFNDLLRGAE